MAHEVEQRPAYKLTRWQRMGLPFLWLLWAMSDPEDRKTWHHVKKGMEKHEHRFTIRTRYRGILRCEHEGCNLCHDTTLD